MLFSLSLSYSQRLLRSPRKVSEIFNRLLKDTLSQSISYLYIKNLHIVNFNAVNLCRMTLLDY